MRSKLATYALAGALGVTGVAGAAFLAPAVSYAATGDSTALDDRVASLKEALAGLVSDGTITQQQADEVATTLAERGPFGGGHGGRGPGGRGLIGAAAEALDLTPQQLREAAEAGSTLAELAEQNDVSQDALVDALVAAEKAHLDAAVSAGRLTRAEADERAAGAEARITESLDEPLRLRGHGHGHIHESGRGGPSPESPSPAPSQTPSQAPSATASPSADA